MAARLRNAGGLVLGGLMAAGLLAGCSAATESPAGSPATQAPSAPVTAPADPVPSGAASATPALALTSAVDTTKASGTARIMSTTTLSGGDSADGSDKSFRMEGVVDFATGAATLRINTALFGTGAGDVEIVAVDQKTYVKVAALGGKYLEVPGTEVGVNADSAAAGLATLTDIADLQKVGTEAVDGVEATKYTGTLDLAKALKQIGVGAGQLGDLVGGLDKNGVAKQSDVTVWVDNDDRVVRFDSVLTADVDKAGRPATVSTSTTFSDFGVAADITAPPADQILSGDMLKKLGDRSGTVD